MDDEFRDLTFSQREGKSPLPETMELEHIPQKFRHLTWRLIDTEIKESSAVVDFGPDGSYYRDLNFIDILWSYRFEIQQIPHDQIPCSPSTDGEFSRKMLLSGSYHQAITFVEYIIRHEQCSDKLKGSLISTFDRSPVAYFVQEMNGKPTVIPRISREAGEATRQAIETLAKGSMNSAAAHLREAAEHINTRQYAGSVRESIHAVESVARVIAPAKSNTLGPALASLKKSGLLNHTALTEAFEKLYGYTNTEQGIRHALLDKDAADVSQDEALFMFGACASFAAYLADKHRRAGEREAGGE